MTRYIRSLHSYIRYSLLLFEPTTLDVVIVNSIHLKIKGNNEKGDRTKKSYFKLHNDNWKGKGKGKDKKLATTKKEEGENPSYTQ